MVNDGTKHHEHRHGHGGPFFTDCERLGEPAGRLASLVAKVKESGTYQRIVAQSDSSDRQLNNATGLIHVESRYSLPIGALDELFFTASGGYTSGQLVVDGEGYSEEDTVDVQVYGKATEKLLLDESKICKRRSRGEDGSWKSGLELWVGLYSYQQDCADTKRSPQTPSRRDEHRAKQSLGFTIIITLPRSSTSLRSLSVHAPRFLVDMTPRLRDVTFGTINIHSENAPIYTAELVSTGSISLVTTNALIHSTGLVKADSITLSTTHGPIDGKWLAAKKISTKTLDAGVSGSYSMHDNGLLIVQTTNGKIDIDISLLPSDNVKLESYKVSTKSTNGQIDINFRQQPMGSHLDFDATTTNARAEVKLDPQFQGKFFVSLSLCHDPYSTDAILTTGRDSERKRKAHRTAHEDEPDFRIDGTEPRIRARASFAFPRAALDRRGDCLVGQERVGYREQREGDCRKLEWCCWDRFEVGWKYVEGAGCSFVPP